ncbi:hypothetical protein L1987_04620 [Smallanthus sonchifolius]|uniref:Uncharacterized protein n=1 Tax=Smallanthus sonchifolius TaxID=185202 RepID=A0ACB9JTD9_9ASTR|nr:hypothetical protein L1987_04620 [Smallanthus sonchifolius]
MEILMKQEEHEDGGSEFWLRIMGKLFSRCFRMVNFRCHMIEFAGVESRKTGIRPPTDDRFCLLACVSKEIGQDM